MRVMRHSSMLILLLGLSSVSVLGESAAGVHWAAPGGWKTAAPQAMRAATYTVAPVTGDTASAECGVYFFGAGQGGSVDANIDRWKSQFQGADGKPAVAKIVKRPAAHGIAITTIDTSGAYSGLGGPVATGRAVPGYRLL